ncbi:hypothetical protein AZE42_01875 [Rhizopogon vesiculosus]|uniref:Manganese/iron superoxide dismutase C-terminal domain-containing protein n=1 Tax=Rhizopogon vesiculosus TaxID=180088 RepID=A0A1J8Q1T9_9AGAM|nr:hypothetical protein AZE42_01875 [Rhizopogon vesiculosus]
MNSAGLRLASSSRASALSAWKSTKCPRQLWGARRHQHTRTELPYKVEEGLGNFMSPRTLKMVSEEYQQGLLDRLSELFPDAADQRKSVTQLVIDTASSGKDALGFSYASHALNNSFFLNCLRPPVAEVDEDKIHSLVISPTIRSHFGGMSQFINNFSSAARGMSGSGYIWLITDSVGNLAIQPTFAAGTLLVRSRACTENPAGHHHEVLHEGRPRENPQPTHLNSGLGSTPTSPTSGMSQGPAPLHPSAPVRTLHSSQRVHVHDGARSLFDQEHIGKAFDPSGRGLRQLGERIYPLFCVSIHEHCWLLDHGVWGKEKYMKELWSVLNWKKINDRYLSFIGANMGSQPLRM